jgi:hypothetical protein
MLPGMRCVAFAIVLASCASWRSVDPHDLANHDRERDRPKRVFVVTPAEAFEMTLTSTDQQTLHGEVVHAWTVPSPNSVVYKNEGPEEMATRLHWVPQHTIPEYVSVPISSVQHARRRKWDATPVAVGVTVSIAFIVGLAFVLSDDLAAGWNE